MGFLSSSNCKYTNTTRKVPSVFVKVTYQYLVAIRCLLIEELKD